MLTGWNAKYTVATIAMVLVAALGTTYFLTRDGDDSAPTTSPTIPVTPTTESASPTADPATTEAPEAGPLIVAPGRVGAAQVGMSKSQAADTGLFNTDVNFGADDCRGTVPLQWKKQFTSLDVLTNDNGTITSIGITAGGPKTAEGIGVGSTYAQVKAAYIDLTPVEEAGFDQSGSYVLAGDHLYLGFLFNENAQDTNQSSKVTFMEVTRGPKPDLIRDGC